MPDFAAQAAALLDQLRRHGAIRHRIEHAAVFFLERESGGHFVEGRGQFAQLILPAHRHAYVEIALFDLMRAADDVADRPGKAA